MTRPLERFRTFALTAAMLLVAAIAHARPITVAWDANSEASIAGYIVSYGPQSRDVMDYPTSIDVGNLLSVQLDLPGDQYYFAVRAYDTDGNVSDYSLEVSDAAGAALTNPRDQFNLAGDLVALRLFATGSPVAYGAANLPPGLTIDPATGLIAGILDLAVTESSVYLVTARAFDPGGNVASVQFWWTVKFNHPPVVKNPGDQSAIPGARATLAIVASDIDDDPLTYSATGLPPGVSIDAATGLISGTIPSDAATAYHVTITVSDGRLSTSIDFSWVPAPPGSLILDQLVFAESDNTEASTGLFSTSVPGETLIAFVAADEFPLLGGQTVSVTGGGLEWTLVTRANGQAGTSEVWTASTSELLTDISVTARSAIEGTPILLTVMTFAGSDGVGASAAASAPDGAPLVSLITTRAGSLVYGVGNDWDAATERVLPADQELVHRTFTFTNDTFWIQRQTSASAAPGVVTQLSNTEPIDHRWNLAAIEILPHIPSALTIGDVSIVEGNAGVTNAVFTVTLSPAVNREVKVNYETFNGSATAGSDYVAVSGQLTFGPGTTTGTINVPVVGDTLVEADETFFVNLTTATNATIADPQGVGTIVNDDVVRGGQMFGSAASTRDARIITSRSASRSATIGSRRGWSCGRTTAGRTGSATMTMTEGTAAVMVITASTIADRFGISSRRPSQT